MIYYIFYDTSDRGIKKFFSSYRDEKRTYIVELQKPIKDKHSGVRHKIHARCLETGNRFPWHMTSGEFYNFIIDGTMKEISVDNVAKVLLFSEAEL